MLLGDVLRKYCLEHHLQHSSVEQLRIVVRQFTRFAGDKPVANISSGDVNGWVAHLAEANVARTVRGKLANLKTLLNAAIDDGDLPALGKIRRIRVPAGCPEAFTPEEIGKLLKACEALGGWFPATGIKRSDWWAGFVNVGWDTAFRLGDLLDLRVLDLREREGSAIVYRVQHKTGRPIVHRLRPETWAIVKRVCAQGLTTRERVFPWGAKRYQFYVAFKKLTTSVGLRGTSKYLRRARATQECKTGGPAAAARVLGHADGTGMLAWKNYIDRSQLDDQLPLPPALPSVSDDTRNL